MGTWGIGGVAAAGGPFAAGVNCFGSNIYRFGEAGRPVGATAVTPMLAADATTTAAAVVKNPPPGRRGARRMKVTTVSPATTLNGLPTASTLPPASAYSTTYVLPSASANVNSPLAFEVTVDATCPDPRSRRRSVALGIGVLSAPHR